MTKRCCECRVDKPLAKFYRHPTHLDGYMRGKRVSCMEVL